jgi:hypothetical protein
MARRTGGLGSGDGPQLAVVEPVGVVDQVPHRTSLRTRPGGQGTLSHLGHLGHVTVETTDLLATTSPPTPRYFPGTCERGADGT